MLCLATEKRLGDQQREVGVTGARGLDSVVDRRLQTLPDGVPPRTDNHRPPDGAILGQLRLGDYLLVPARKILLLGRQHSSHAGATLNGARVRHRLTLAGRS
jgi:hypothetical protein